MCCLVKTEDLTNGNWSFVKDTRRIFVLNNSPDIRKSIVLVYQPSLGWLTLHRFQFEEATSNTTWGWIGPSDGEINVHGKRYAKHRAIVQFLRNCMRGIEATHGANFDRHLIDIAGEIQLPVRWAILVRDITVCVYLTLHSYILTCV